MNCLLKYDVEYHGCDVIKPLSKELFLALVNITKTHVQTVGCLRRPPTANKVTWSPLLLQQAALMLRRREAMLGIQGVILPSPGGRLSQTIKLIGYPLCSLSYNRRFLVDGGRQDLEQVSVVSDA